MNRSQPSPADGSLLLGVDFTSAPTRKKPITVAVGRCSRGEPMPIYQLDEIRGLVSLKGYEAFLQESGPWLGGFDLPFGQPRTLIEHEGWPTDWPKFVQFFCAQPRATLRDTFKRWCDARPSGDKFAWRRADKPAGSSPAMRWTNPPVAWMMHAGIARMLDAGLVFPAHRHGTTSGHERVATEHRIALEAYPGFTARKVCRTSYKSDATANQTPARVWSAGRPRSAGRLDRLRIPRLTPGACMGAARQARSVSDGIPHEIPSFWPTRSSISFIQAAGYDG